MNKLAAFAAFGLLAIGMQPATALDRRVEIVNESSYDIVQFYASNTGSKSWEEDILGRSTLPAGTSIVINIDDGSGYCKYDFLAVFEDGDELIKSDQNVCELSRFTYTD